MKKIIFMGKTGSGKTTLCQKLHDLDIKYRKTQSVEIYSDAIDTPGEFMENRWMYTSLATTAVDAKVIALVYDCTQQENYIAPGFATMFCKDVIGIITKISRADEYDIKVAYDRLKLAGVKEIFKVDTIDNIGINELVEYLSLI
ncbi:MULTISPECIES: EutP/PduV family microcompartment system protein [unclassified Romboutsia]|uniref:EutP/PduV family microcompartment system protein n=1 Tax=unclassified Romboutsia TaxID=2626894 RepID=UPI000822DC63|nr:MULTISPECIES: EutP/PduV family microcompartment system protein [unclassified Romboutsia]SCI25766.1 ethanolamine utilization protein EutP [uncultured Clostridium sp.]